MALPIQSLINFDRICLILWTCLQMWYDLLTLSGPTSGEFSRIQSKIHASDKYILRFISVCSMSEPERVNISASTWSNFKIKDSFEILRTSRFQNCPSFFNLVKIWGSYCQNTNWELFSWTPCSNNRTSSYIFYQMHWRMVNF